MEPCLFLFWVQQNATLRLDAHDITGILMQEVAIAGMTSFHCMFYYISMRHKYKHVRHHLITVIIVTPPHEYVAAASVVEPLTFNVAR